MSLAMKYLKEKEIEWKYDKRRVEQKTGRT
jgi:hypothetical protein